MVKAEVYRRVHRGVEVWQCDEGVPHVELEDGGGRVPGQGCVADYKVHCALKPWAP